MPIPEMFASFALCSYRFPLNAGKSNPLPSFGSSSVGLVGQRCGRPSSTEVLSICARRTAGVCFQSTINLFRVDVESGGIPKSCHREHCRRLTACQHEGRALHR